ncbi:hypothetical protein C8A05DRAFT_29306 [Staphylotrichum tortipilum]|uniref:Ankyrin repeat protein n=1 Tax=Staphylotrichum tortipilum TaxID=2831512 RepID=A0AAN6MUK0_9PEZI|nr:hypothetical protein C8A05DRAFT_29306 [Staphylotrichum longicolle]
MENWNVDTPEEAEEALRQFVARRRGCTTDGTDPPAADEDSSLWQPAIRDQAMKWAIRTGCDAAIDTALHLGASISAVPVTAVTGTMPVGILGGGSDNTANATGDGPIIIKALTLQLAARARQIETFSRLVFLGARLDEPGTSVASVRCLIRRVMRGPDAAALLPLFFPSDIGKSTHFARQLSQDLRNEALIWLLQGYASPRSPKALSLEAYLGFVRALLDAGASPDLVRRAALRSTSTLSAAVNTLEPDLVRLLVYRGACPDGPQGLEPPLIPQQPFHIPLCTIAYTMAKSLLDPPLQATLRQMVDVLVAGGADINIHAPYRDNFPCWITFTSPLVIFLDAVDCWDENEGGGGPEALDALRFLLDRGADPNNPPRHPSHEPEGRLLHLPALYVGQRPYYRNQARTEPIADLLKRWGVGKLASPAFASALELLVGHPRTRGGVCKVADTLAFYDHTLSPTLSDTIPLAQNDDAILAAWRRVISATARLLTPHELGQFLHAYVVRKGTCPRHRHIRWHRSQDDEIGDLARLTIAELLAAGADVNHRLAVDWWPHDEACSPTALHSISLWLAGRSNEELEFNSWQPGCKGLRHSPRRAGFVRFLVEKCGADAGLMMRYEGRTPAEILVQLRLPEVDKQETEDRYPYYGVEEHVAREGREAIVALLEKPPPPPPPPPLPPPPPPRASCVCL